MLEGLEASGYTQWRRGGRVVECGGLENRYVGNPGVGGSNPPLSALIAGQLVSTLPCRQLSACQLGSAVCYSAAPAKASAGREPTGSPALETGGAKRG